jgi:ZIP family zinc transporter
VTFTTTLLLGLVAGGTILLGMPIARLRRPAPRLALFLNAIAIGILLFLVWDVLSAAWEPTEAALTSVHAGEGGLGQALGYGLLLAAGLAAGLLGLVAYELWMRRVVERSRAAVPDRAEVLVGGGAGPGTTAPRPASGIASWTPARQLSLLIAVGIGAHNLAEGLAIGQSAAAGDIALATMLVIGFALHNATEGFGIVAPLAGEVDDEGRRILPSWGFLVVLAAIGGGPTFVGTLLGRSVVNEAVSVAFLSLAAGSIIYVLLQLISTATKARRPELLATGLLLGLLAGFATDAILVAAGA